MDGTRQYLMSLITAAIICSIIQGMFASKGTYRSLLQLLTGIVMLAVLLSPLRRITIPEFSSYPESFAEQAREYITDGTDAANLAKADIIKAQTEAYILDKASSLKADISVEVIMCNESGYMPVEVSLHGTISPYAKRVLEREIETQLGVPKENQQWS